MANAIQTSISDLALLRRIELKPEWADSAREVTREDEEGLDAFCAAIGWAPPHQLRTPPRANDFPLLIFHPDHGWAVAERLESDNRVQIMRHGMPAVWQDADKARLYDLVIPLPAGQQQFTRAIDVFKTAVMRRKNVIVVAIVATVVVNFIALITSLYTMQVYDRVVPRGAFSTLFVLTVGVFVAFAFDFTLRVVRANLMEREAAHIDTEVSEFFFSRAAEARLDARPPSVGTMAAQLRGQEQVRSMISSGIVFAFADLPFALLFIGVVALIGGIISVVLLVAFPLAIIIALVFARLIRKDTERTQVSSNRKNGLLVEALDAAETVKANRGQWYMLSRWSSLLDELHDSEVPTKKLQAKAGSIFGVLQQATYVTLIAWGSYEVFNNRISLGGLIACSILAGRVNGPLIAQLPNLLVQWSYSRSALKMLDGILALPVDRQPGTEQLRPARLAPSLVFKDVEFAYPGGRAGINVPKLEIAAGERIGMIGGVGSGKSTLLKLMSGLYPPQKGQVLIDRLDMTQVAEDILRTSVGYLPQDYRLVNGNLRDNLTLGIPDPGDDKIMEMAQATGLASLITSHPRGLDLPISEGGRGLSGGQRTLTGLTRLLLAEPKLLLLDEPTSNLDVDTEALVLRTITQRLSSETTLIMVTHKLQLVNLVSRVVLVANGQVAMDGPTAEVMKRLRPNQGGQQQQPTATATTSASQGKAVTITPRRNQEGAKA